MEPVLCEDIVCRDVHQQQPPTAVHCIANIISPTILCPKTHFIVGFIFILKTRIIFFYLAEFDYFKICIMCLSCNILVSLYLCCQQKLL